MKRIPEDCEHRIASSKPDGGMICRLLSRLSGVQNDDLVEINREICNACCESFFPTTQDWNPVIASLMHALGQRVIESDGVTGCSVEQAESICQSAINQLPIVLPNEDDCVDDAQIFQRPKELSLEELVELIPLPHRQSPNTVRWAVGMTTSPRRQPTLAQSLESLLASGWQDPHLFIDGDVDVPREFDPIMRTIHPSPSGAWPAWRRAAEGLLQSYPNANAVMIVQDDALFPHIACLRGYVESLLWPCDALKGRESILSLYTSTDDTINESRWRVLPRRWVYGAVAMVFSPEQLRSILRADREGLLDVVVGHAGVDTRIGHWAQQSGIDVWHPSPSLVQHIGQVSTVWLHSRAVGLRRARRFIADEV